MLSLFGELKQVFKKPQRIKKKDKNGNTIICTIDENGVEQGLFEIRFWDGKSGKGTYKDGEWNGPFKNYYDNGQLCEKCAYKDGVPDGLYESYHRNGQLFIKCTYKDGKIDGPRDIYDEDGVLRENGIYRDGKVLKGKKAESYLREWEDEQKRSAEEAKRQKIDKKVAGLKAKLAEVRNLEKVKAMVKPARTPERTEILARITRVRRARDILSKAAQKVQKEGDKETLNEIIELSKPFAAQNIVVRNKFHQRQAERRAKKDRE